MRIKRNHLNITIDVLMFVVMMPVVGIGFLMKFVLLSGIDRNVVYGNDVDLLFLGMDRHQWGAIHLQLSMLLILLLLLHLVFHWKMMIALFKNMVVAPVWRTVAAVVLPLTVVFFAIAPLFVQPEVRQGVEHHAHQPALQKEEYLKIVAPKVMEHVHSVEINGQMTIGAIAQSSSISVDQLCQHLGVPQEKSGETLGRLKKQYGFDMDELRNYIENKSNKGND